MNSISCPVCGKATHFITEKKDRFNADYRYVACKNCHFLFEEDLVLHPENLAKKVSGVYQKDYFDTIDTGWKMRGDGFLKIIKKIIKIYQFLKIEKRVTILDYGGGNGYLASKLAPHGNVFYYDKYEKPSIMGEYTVLENPIKAEILYAVELVEHITDISEWNFLKELSPDMFVFTTCLSDNIKKEEMASWEYLHTDGGHTAIYSCQSLYLLGEKYGFMYFFFPNIACHIFIKNQFLSRINFVKIEYFMYNILRKVKNFNKK